MSSLQFCRLFMVLVTASAVGPGGPRLVRAQAVAPAIAPAIAPAVLPAVAQDVFAPPARDSLAGALFARAMHADSLGDLSTAIVDFRRAIQRAETVRDMQTLGDAWHNGGVLHWTRANYDSALVWLHHAQALREVSGERVAFGRTLNTLGSSYYQLGQYGPALEAFFRAVTVWRQTHDSVGVARTLTNIGKTYHDWGQLERAQGVLRDAVDAARLVPRYPVTLGYALNSLAMLAIERKDFDAVRPLLMESRAQYSTRFPTVTPSDSAGAWSLNTSAMALLHIREGHPEFALPLLDSVRQVATVNRSVRGLSRVNLYFGEAYQALGDRTRARAALAASLAHSRSVDQRILMLDALRRLAAVEESAGRSVVALGHLRAYHALRDTVFDQDAAQRIAVMQAREETERARMANLALREAQRTQSVVISRQRTAVALGSVILVLALTLAGVLVFTNRRGRLREAALARANTDLNTANGDLRNALSEVRTLSGLIPICSCCKKVRDDRGYWEAVETYVSNHSDASFSHGICESCGPVLYGDLWHTTEDGTDEQYGAII